jgi:hypothetical protein
VINIAQTHFAATVRLDPGAYPHFEIDAFVVLGAKRCSAVMHPYSFIKHEKPMDRHNGTYPRDISSPTTPITTNTAKIEQRTAMFRSLRALDSLLEASNNPKAVDSDTINSQHSPANSQTVAIELSFPAGKTTDKI